MTLNLSAYAQITTGCPGCPSPKDGGGVKEEPSNNVTRMQKIISDTRIKSLENLRIKISQEVREQAKICTKYRGYGAKKITRLYHVLLVSYNDSVRSGVQPRGECNDCDQTCSLMTTSIKSELKKMVEDEYFISYLLQYYSTNESDLKTIITDFKKFSADENN